VAPDRYVLGLLALCASGGWSSVTAQATPVATTTAAAAATPSADSVSMSVTDSIQRAREIEVMRETFAYQGGPRDPFNSLISGASNGPELADLQLVGIYQDMRVPSNSVVVLREKVGEKRHKMRAGDRLGRIRLAQIRRHEAVFMIQDLGFERQETLSLRKQEDVTP
jgi:hypothetical protein